MERMIPGRTGRAWIALEVVLATALALYLALRLDRPSLWVLVPLCLLALPGRNAENYGLDFRFTPPSWRVHLVFGAALLAVYAVAHAVFVLWLANGAFIPRRPPEMGWLFLRQLVVVAFPEELFFRGYLQWNLYRVLPRSRRLFGADVGPALVVQAAVFALCHVADGDWTRARVFFFGLLAGWLRDRSGSIAGPILYHAVANFWYVLLAASFRPS